MDIQITNPNGHLFKVGFRHMMDLGYPRSAYWDKGTAWLDIATGELDIYIDYEEGLFMVKKVGADFDYSYKNWRCPLTDSKIPVCSFDLPLKSIGSSGIKVEFAKLDPSLYGKPVQILWP